MHTPSDAPPPRSPPTAATQGPTARGERKDPFTVPLSDTTVSGALRVLDVEQTDAQPASALPATAAAVLRDDFAARRGEPDAMRVLVYPRDGRACFERVHVRAVLERMHALVSGGVPRSELLVFVPDAL